MKIYRILNLGLKHYFTELSELKEFEYKGAKNTGILSLHFIHIIKQITESKVPAIPA